MEAIKGIQTLQQLAKEFQVHPTQITMWKKQVSSHVADLFQRGPEGTRSMADEELRQAWIERIERAGSQVSMDSRDRVFDNIFIERL